MWLASGFVETAFFASCCWSLKPLPPSPAPRGWKPMSVGNAPYAAQVR